MKYIVKNIASVDMIHVSGVVFATVSAEEAAAAVAVEKVVMQERDIVYVPQEDGFLKVEAPWIHPKCVGCPYLLGPCVTECSGLC